MTCGTSALMELPLCALLDGVDFVISTANAEQVVTLNSVTMSSLGLKVERVDGWRGSPARRWQTVFVPGRAGLTKAASVVEEAPVELRVSGTLRAASVAALQTNFDTLASLLAETPLVVVCPDNVTRAMQADLSTMSSEPFGPQFSAIDMPIVITLTCVKPYKYDLVDTVGLAPAGTTLRLPLGTAPVRPKITVSGVASSPVVTLSDYNGTSIATMTYSGALVAGDVLVFDCDLMTVRKNGVSVLASVSGTFFKIDPSTAALYRIASWPRLSCSSGDLEVRYQRAWLL